MELRQLEYFVYVAEEGSFTRAAAKAHVAQPGVSAQIQRLEREVGEALFDVHCTDWTAIRPPRGAFPQAPDRCTGG